ncbi:MAG: hypothetical protein AABY18_00760 [Candidatus Thermoplasmatota archaeon]
MTAKKERAPAPEVAAPSPPTQWQRVERTPTEVVRNTVLAIALILLAAACVTAFYAALRIASIWFEARFVPIAQLVVAGFVIAVCVAVVRRVKSR